jgi:IS30 family transposase
MTVSQELEAKILRYFHVEKWRVGTIATQLGVHHATVERVLSQAGLPKSARAHRASLCDPYLPFVRRPWSNIPD